MSMIMMMVMRLLMLMLFLLQGFVVNSVSQRVYLTKVDFLLFIDVQLIERHNGKDRGENGYEGDGKDNSK